MAILSDKDCSFGWRLRRLQIRQLPLNPFNNRIEHFLRTLTPCSRAVVRLNLEFEF